MMKGRVLCVGAAAVVIVGFTACRAADSSDASGGDLSNDSGALEHENVLIDL